MRVLVYGGRTYRDADTMLYVLGGYAITRLIHGGARGADTLAARYALEANIPCTCFPAKWSLYGKSAGPLRNQQMLDEGKPELAIAFPGGVGTADMTRRVVRARIPLVQIPEINYEVFSSGTYPGEKP